jgi:hypothetical protein
MDYSQMRPIGDLLKSQRNIILKGADAATRGGFTQVPNFLLKSKNLSAGDKLAFAMLLSYAWQNDHCFPGQQRLAEDMGLHETTYGNTSNPLRRTVSWRSPDAARERPISTP